MSGGVYEIVNTANGRRYIGSSQDIRDRFFAHQLNLRKGTHCNKRLQRAWNRDGAAAFQFRVLAILENCEILPTEQRLLDVAFKDGNLYNTAIDVTSGMKGRRHSEDALLNIGAGVSAHYEKPGSHEAASKRTKKSLADPIVRAQRFKDHKKNFSDPVVKERISAAQKKRFSDPAARAKHSASYTLESKRTLSEIRKAYLHEHPEATMRGVKQSPEHVRKRKESFAATIAARRKA